MPIFFFFFFCCKTFRNFCEICVYVCISFGIDISCIEISFFWILRSRIASTVIKRLLEMTRGSSRRWWLNARHHSNFVFSNLLPRLKCNIAVTEETRGIRHFQTISKTDFFPLPVRKPLENQTVWLSFRLLTINRSFPPLINTLRSIFPSTLKLLDNWSLSLSLFLWVESEPVLHFRFRNFYFETEIPDSLDATPWNFAKATFGEWKNEKKKRGGEKKKKDRWLL